MFNMVFGTAGAAAAEEAVRFTTHDAVLAAVLLAVGTAMLWLWHASRERRDRVRPLFCPWGAADILLALGVFVIFSWAVTTVAETFIPGEDHPWREAAAMGVVGVATCVLILWHLGRRYGLRPRDVGLRLDGWLWDLVLAAALLLVVLAVQRPMGFALEHLSRWAGEPPQPQKMVTTMHEVDSVFGLGVLAALALLAAPFWEEIVFRGFLQPFLAGRLGAPSAIVVTSVLFSLIHYSGSKVFIVPALVFPLALALGYAYHRTQRLAAPLMLHVLHNLVTVLRILDLRNG